jgi:small subunit ribosomal protein S27e
MKRENILVPKPRSNFISVQCNQCEEKVTVFTHTTTDIVCKACGEVIAVKSGSKAKILGKLLGTLDQ